LVLRFEYFVHSTELSKCKKVPLLIFYLACLNSISKMAANVCVCAVVGFRSRHCPRGQTLNEDNTYSLHVTPPLRKHFVGGRWFYTNSAPFGTLPSKKSFRCFLSPKSILKFTKLSDESFTAMYHGPDTLSLNCQRI
jgi:hypothetical protein